MAEKAEGAPVDETAEALSCYPSPVAQRFRSMSAYGYHYRVKSAEAHLRTCDSGIAATFFRECRYGLRDRNPVVAPVEYVGHLQEIIELDYIFLRQVVLIGTWVKANYRGPNATVKRDHWGFTIANFGRMIPFGRDSFAFPSQVEQVFFSDCLESSGWKVVVRTEPRGKRVVANSTDEDGGLLFRHGRDSEFEGLRSPAIISEDPIQAPTAGRFVRVPETADIEIEDLHTTFDADLGASSEED